MNRHSVMVLFCAAICVLVVVVLSVGSVTDETARRASMNSSGVDAPVSATIVQPSSDGGSAASGDASSLPSTRLRLVHRTCQPGGEASEAALWLTFEHPAAWWVGTTPEGGFVQSSDPTALGQSDRGPRVTIGICPRDRALGPPSEAHSQRMITIAGEQRVLYEVESASWYDFQGRVLTTNFVIDSVPVVVEAGFADSLDAEALGRAIRDFDRVASSIQRVPVPAVGADWQSSSVGLSMPQDSGPTHFVDLQIAPNWAVDRTNGGNALVIRPASDRTGGIEVRLTDDLGAAGWTRAHPWLDDRFFGGSTRLVPGLDQSADRWLVDAVGRGLIIAPRDPSHVNVFADPTLHMILSAATIRSANDPNVQTAP